MRAEAAEHGPGHLHGVLKRLDPEAAERISPADEQKLIRAIEVCLLTKKPLSQIHQNGRVALQGWRALKIGLQPERDALYQRIHKRTDMMLASGWVEEVRALVAGRSQENAKPFDFIGYREIRSVLRGEMTQEAARSAIQQTTRQYAKRQITWFRREAGVHWISGFGDDPKTQCDALDWLQQQSLEASRRMERMGV